MRLGVPHLNAKRVYLKDLANRIGRFQINLMLLLQNECSGIGLRLSDVTAVLWQNTEDQVF